MWALAPRGAASALAFVVALLVPADLRRADEATPIFEGDPDLTRYTKEFALELTPSLTEAGPAVGAGLAISSFYTRWLASFAGATYSPSWAGPRERWDARGGGRLVYPEPLFGKVFGYVLGGGGLLFTRADEPQTFHRSLTAVVGAGLFANLGERARFRVELREHLKLYGRSDTSHTATLGVSFVFLAR